MIQAALDVQAFVQDRRFEEFTSDKILRYAVERQIEVMGEAASRSISTALKGSHPEIPWKSIIAQRNVLAHDYGEIKLDRLWIVATTRVPELVSLLEPLIPPLPDVEE